MVNATQTENRTEYACRPTNEDSLAAFLVDRNDYHFFNRDIFEKNKKLSQLLSLQMQSMRQIHFGWLLTTKNASNEEKKENQDNCSWPSWRGISQSCKTKAASSEEWMNDTMDRSKSRYFNRWRAYFSEIYPVHSTTQTWNSWICREKKTILSCLENSCF